MQRALGERPLDGLTVGLFGHYDASYARNRIIAKALARTGAEVVHIAEHGRFASRTPRLVRRLRRQRPDIVLVCFPGHSDMVAARVACLGRRAPVLLDLFTSLWETAVVDREHVTPRSLRALRYRSKDRLACALADAILLDTDAHIEWTARELSIDRARFRRLWVGADDDVMRPLEPTAPAETFTVFFCGTFIPLHGVEHILHAAQLLERRRQDMRIVLCGSGQTHRDALALAWRLGLERVEFLGRQPPEEVARLIAASDLCLGIFGTSDKALNVVPNKVYDALACRRPVLTADTPGARECLEHGRHAWLCPPGRPDALADAIEALAEDSAARERIAAGGYELFLRRFSIDAIGRELAPIMLEVLRRER